MFPWKPKQCSLSSPSSGWPSVFAKDSFPQALTHPVAVQSLYTMAYTFPWPPSFDLKERNSYRQENFPRILVNSRIKKQNARTSFVGLFFIVLIYLFVFMLIFQTRSQYV